MSAEPTSPRSVTLPDVDMSAFAAASPFQAAIFDMDGLLIESESRWRRAEREIAAELGVPLTEADLEATMGMRMPDVAERWFEAYPWNPPPHPGEVADRVVRRVVELTADATALPGVPGALALCERRGLRIALCSSSAPPLIDATLARLGLAERFEVVHSAASGDYGKPHPLPYLDTASELAVDPRACVAFEDSFAGCLSAKAAGMVTVAVPADSSRGDIRFGAADLVLASLEDLSEEVLRALEARAPMPSVARPRFHLALPVDDLDRARAFYVDRLGCREGRASEAWVDFDLWGHQLVCHLAPGHEPPPAFSEVDGDEVPIPHFGIILTIPAFRALVARLEHSAIPHEIPPRVRFSGQPGEQHTCFFRDPAGNAIEVKAFADDRAIFSPFDRDRDD